MSAFHCGSLVTSILALPASPRAVRMSAATRSASPPRMSATMTLAPSCAKRCASASPMPCPAPVMIATLSLRRIVPSPAFATLMVQSPSFGGRFVKRRNRFSLARYGTGNAWLASPGCHSGIARRARPGIYEHGPLENGFRARRCSAPRNDDLGAPTLGMVHESLLEKAHALAPARPEPDRDPWPAPRDAGDGGRDRAARLCGNIGVELVRQHGAVHRPRLHYRT